MRTYKVTFNEKNVSRMFNYKKDEEDFRRMRAFILRGYSSLNHTFIDALVDVCDDIKSMNVGETIFVITSPYYAYYEWDIKSFNEKIAMMDNFAWKHHMENCLPDEHSAFMVKRTEKLWKLSGLNCNIED